MHPNQHLSLPQPQLPFLGDNQQLPDMREVLMNSLRINKKLHGEIVAKEYSVKNESQLVNLKLQALYRDMQEIYSKTQHLYEETVRQNQKTRFMAEELLKPFRDELKGKVDETTLSLKMKMMLSEFDNLGHRISYDKEGNEVRTDDNHTFRFIRSEVLPLISSIQRQLMENSQTTKRQEEGLSTLAERQEEVVRDVIKVRENLFAAQASLLDQINSKINEEIWEYRFSNFYESFIAAKINAIAAVVDRHHKEAHGGMAALREEVGSLEKGVKMIAGKSQASSAELSRKIESMREEVTKITRINVTESLSEMRKTIEQKHSALKKQLSQDIQKDKISLILEDNNSLKEKLQSLSTSLQSEVEKAIQSFDKGLVVKVARLDSQLKATVHHLRGAQKMLQGNQYQIGFIKDLLSKKANFSDVIVHIENKADKQDYRELKEMIASNTNLHVEEDQCLLTQEEQREIREMKVETAPNKFRKRNSPASRKNYQQSTSPFADSERDDSVKRYMLGLKNGTTTYTRDNLLKQKSKFLFLNQSERRKPKGGSKGQTFTQNFI